MRGLDDWPDDEDDELEKLADAGCYEIGNPYYMSPEDDDRVCGECESCKARKRLWGGPSPELRQILADALDKAGMK